MRSRRACWRTTAAAAAAGSSPLTAHHPAADPRCPRCCSTRSIYRHSQWGTPAACGWPPVNCLTPHRAKWPTDLSCSKPLIFLPAHVALFTSFVFPPSHAPAPHCIWASVKPSTLTMSRLGWGGGTGSAETATGFEFCIHSIRSATHCIHTCFTRSLAQQQTLQVSEPPRCALITPGRRPPGSCGAGWHWRAAPRAPSSRWPGCSTPPGWRASAGRQGAAGAAGTAGTAHQQSAVAPVTPHALASTLHSCSPSAAPGPHPAPPRLIVLLACMSLCRPPTANTASPRLAQLP